MFIYFDWGIIGTFIASLGSLATAATFYLNYKEKMNQKKRELQKKKEVRKSLKYIINLKTNSGNSYRNVIINIQYILDNAKSEDLKKNISVLKFVMEDYKNNNKEEGKTLRDVENNKWNPDLKNKYDREVRYLKSIYPEKLWDKFVY
ncbi:hypothetical protein [Ligilactobacillus salivarius]|uniref:hypothetical protein n=1 Tax=Ligilactobacillus salivarius TaxID=1624 RepID=UPI0011C8E299|nr:hypothetical protein [Ligilactobacillus salivarius]MDO5004219.1 hypothetical protein [Ligilactobacillus salivarius]TXJ78167.1 hypothetical protein FGO85_01030 [Ligilactobacillus salivarius]